jgi:hypothetical protein
MDEWNTKLLRDFERWSKNLIDKEDNRQIVTYVTKSIGS